MHAVMAVPDVVLPTTGAMRKSSTKEQPTRLYQTSLGLNFLYSLDVADDIKHAELIRSNHQSCGNLLAELCRYASLV